jgi:shikimate dehydrogenase
MTNHESRSTSHVSRITGSTRLTGVIGWPVSHSLSPRMHNAAFAALGLDWAYVPLPVPPERVGDAVRGLVALGFAGANVTVPHKQAAIPFLDELTPVARAIGAVNTIVVRPDGSLLGDNTDGGGFMADLKSQMANGKWQIEHALVLGAGGAARAIVYALVEAGTSVAVVNRTADRAFELCQTIGSALPHATDRLSAHAFPDALDDLTTEADLIVNSTSLGLHEGDPMPWDAAVAFRPGRVVYDLIYNRPTEMLALARAQGATALDGLGMLVHQGARAFELWTGVAAPIDVMMRASRET